MSDSVEVEAVRDALRRINEAWLNNRPQDLHQLFHKNIIMVLPGFSGRAEGRQALIASFEEFCENGAVHHFNEKMFRWM